jgi:glycosidase
MKTTNVIATLVALLGLGIATSCNPNRKDVPIGNDEDSLVGNPVIYQMLVRLFGNADTTNKPFGTIEENGVGKFNDVTDLALAELRQLGVTHVWYTGVLEHATMTALEGVPADDADVVKGRAGSPYAIKDYYDIAPALASTPAKRMDEFQQLLERTHQHRLKAIIDFVPNHVARSYHSDAKPAGVKDLGEDDDTTKSFLRTNNFYYLPGQQLKVPAYNPLEAEAAPGEDGLFAEHPAKVTGNNVFNPTPNVGDWFETVKLNYGVEFAEKGEIQHFDPETPPTWTKMRDILMYWADKGVDGFRCDVSEMVPVQFWAWAIKSLKEKHPKLIFIAEVYNPAMYHDYVQTGGFDYLYDKVGVYDRIRAVMSGKSGATTMGIDSGLAQSKGIESHMLRFLENHDEQRIASPDFAGDPRAGIPGMTVTALLGPSPTMLYFGQESGEPGKGGEGFGGEDGRTTIFDYWGVPAHQAWLNGGKFDGGGLSSEQKELRRFYAALCKIVSTSPIAAKGKMIPIPQEQPHAYAFVRHLSGKCLLVVANFDPSISVAANLILPQAAWDEMKLNPQDPHPMKEVLFGKDRIDLNWKATLQAPGIPIIVKPWSALVFECDAAAH